MEFTYEHNFRYSIMFPYKKSQEIKPDFACLIKIIKFLMIKILKEIMKKVKLIHKLRKHNKKE